MLVVVRAGMYARVEAHHLPQALPSFDVVGRPGGVVRPLRDRLRAAFMNNESEYVGWPHGRITVNVTPRWPSRPGEEPSLAIATALICLYNEWDIPELADIQFNGRIGIDGTIQDGYFDKNKLDNFMPLLRGRVETPDSKLKFVGNLLVLSTNLGGGNARTTEKQEVQEP